MQADLTESVQASIRPGEMKDSFYYGETNLAKQAYPCVVNNRFVQTFTNFGQGSSQFVLSPFQGMSDICLSLTMPAIATYANLALNSGWGYSLINRISVRYGSSAQYFWSGTQMYLQNCIDCETNSKVDAMTTLGGAPLAAINLLTPNTAYVYLKLPHNSIRADGKPLPFPSDNLVQPIVITVELYNPQTTFMVTGAGTNVAATLAFAPTTLSNAVLQLKQEMLTDTSDLLARRIDMNTHAYTHPLPYFAQQEVQITLQNATISQSVNLTGFRAGEVKQILLWLTNNTEQVQSSGAWAPLKWWPIGQVNLTYNGEVFSRYDAGVGQLWNLAADSKSLVANQLAYEPQTANTGSVPYPSTWTECPFAQVALPVDKEMLLVHGKPILNAVVNLSFNTPNTSSNFTLHAMYLYNASLLCSRGSAEYIF